MAAALHGSNLATIGALVRRARNELIRVPGAAIPGVMAPAIFFIGLSAVFGHLSLLPGFTTLSYQSFLIPVSILQGAGFTGAATGVNLARDIEQGWFDRMLASPAPRWTILAGMVTSAAIRSLIPATFLLIIGFALGVHWPGIDGLFLVYVLVMGMGAIAALWGIMLALRFRSQSAAPLMQAGMFVAVLMTTAYAPADLLQGWLHTVSQINPVTHVIEAARQGFTAEITLSGTWPAFAAIAGLILVLGAFAMRGMFRIYRADRRPPSAISAGACFRPAGPRGSAGACRSRIRDRAPAGIPGSGTGTPASRRFPGGGSMPRGRGASSRRWCAPCDPTGSSDTWCSGIGG